MLAPTGELGPEREGAGAGGQVADILEAAVRCAGRANWVSRTRRAGRVVVAARVRLDADDTACGDSPCLGAVGDDEA